MLQSSSGASAMSGHGRPPSANPGTSAAPANAARAASSIPVYWSPPLGRDSKTPSGKGGNLESSGNGPLSDDGAKRRKPGGNWRNPLQDSARETVRSFAVLPKGCTTPHRLRKLRKLVSAGSGPEGRCPHAVRKNSRLPRRSRAQSCAMLLSQRAIDYRQNRLR
jgi:hypothetical protein